MRAELKISTVILLVIFSVFIIQFSSEVVFSQSYNTLSVESSFGNTDDFYIGTKISINCFGRIEVYKGAELKEISLGTLEYIPQESGEYLIKCGEENRTIFVKDVGLEQETTTSFITGSEEELEEIINETIEEEILENTPVKKETHKLEFQNLSQINDTSNITKFTIEYPGIGEIRFIQSINLSGSPDINSIVSISNNFISVDTIIEPRLNKSATLFFYNLHYKQTPIILRDGEICSDCKIESYQQGNLTFNVTHFTNYTSGANSNLTIWDDTDPEGGTQTKNIGEQINFFANYTNKTSGESINGTGVYCEIQFSDLTDDMVFNGTSLLWEFNRSFDSEGTYDWNVTCNGSSTGYEILSITDTVGVVGFTGTYLTNGTATTNSTFLNGTFNSTKISNVLGAVVLNNSDNGTYTSQVFNADINSKWKNISWTSNAIGELPANQQVEIKFADGNANMTGNILLYHFNNDSGYGENNTHIYDFSGSGNNGTSHADAHPIAAGKFNGAFDFDGTGDYINTTLTDDLSGGGEFSVFAWVKDIPSGSQYVISQMHAVGYASDWILGYTNGGLWFRSSTIDGGDVISDGNWHHFGFTFNGTTAKLYIDGAQYGSPINPAGFGGISSVKIMTRGDAASGFVSGSIDEVAIFNRTLSGQEILDNYKRGALRLNLTVRSCNDTNCSEGSWTDIGDTNPQNLSIADNQYFQYKFSFETDNFTNTPELYNVTVFYGPAEDNSPVITLNFPYPNYINSTSDPVNVTFNCSATDDVSMANISLYITNSSNQSFSLNQTTNISGIGNSSSWTLELGNGNYTWNCIGYDNNYQYDWGENRTVKIDYTAPVDYNITYLFDGTTTTHYGYLDGTLNNTSCNNSIDAIQLSANHNNGTYTSQVFDVDINSKWKNISWIEGVPYEEELPDNKIIENVLGGANMTGNVLLYHFNNNSAYGENNTHVYDFSGNGNNGTGINFEDDEVINNGKFNGAFDFDGNNDWVMGPPSNDITGDYLQTITFSVWVKHNDTGDNGYIASIKRSASNSTLISLDAGSNGAGSLGFLTRNYADTDHIWLDYNGGYNDNKWHQLVAVINGLNRSLYIDGSYIKSDNQGMQNVSGNTARFSVGSFSASLYFNGSIDEVAIWNRSLSSDEILNIYKRGILRLNLTVRSCDDINCNGDIWNKTYKNSSTQTLNVEDNQYFQYKINFFTENTGFSPKLYNVSIGYEIIDNVAPIINLESPANDTTNTNDETPDFVFNATDNIVSALDCSLWMNATTGGTPEIKATNSSVNNGTSTTITPTTPLNDNLYLWWINCSDGKNTNISEKRLINISVGDTEAPTIELVSPENQTKNTTDNTPDFRFIPKDNLADTLSCVLWINATISGTPQEYGYEPSLLNGSAATITANQSLSNQNYTWWINCSDGANINISEKWIMEIYVDINNPVVNLNCPIQNNNSLNFSNIIFNCSATDDIYLKNISLYSDYAGIWQYIDTDNLSGTEDLAVFTKNILQNKQFTNNHFKWNCLAYDNTSKSTWNAINYSFSNWDLGSYNNTVYNTTLHALTLINFESDGFYVSQVFDANSTTGWRNISWAEEGNFEGELPNDKGSSSQIDMTGNILLYHFNNDSGYGENNTHIYDFSGSGNNGTSHADAHPIAAGKFNGAFDFDGTGDYIDTGITKNLSGSGDFTVEAWVKAEDNNQVYAITQAHTLGSYGSDWIFFYGSGNSLFWMRNVVLNKPTGFDGTKWNHLVMVWNESARTYEGFVNGGSIGVSGIVSDYGGVGSIKIGTRGDATSSFFRGIIDEVAIFNRTLSAEEIQKHYNQSISRLNLTVRSCNDLNCDGESWSEKLTNSTFSEIPAPNNQYFQYKVTMEQVSNSITPKIYNITINYGDPDYDAPTMNQISPSNNSGDNDGHLVFEYNLSDVSYVSNCSLILNRNVNQTNSSIIKKQNINFTLNNLSIGSYNWSITCTDINGNQGNTPTRYFDVILATDFGGETTDLSQVNDTSDIENFTVENIEDGKIKFTQNVNLSGGVNLNNLINLSNNFISVNTITEPRLNKSATLFFYNLTYKQTPIIIRDGEICSDCKIESYQQGNLTFNVTHFTNYTSGANSNLTIWDDTDPEGGTKTKYPDNQINFFANYTNRTSGESINGTGVYCEIQFSDLTDNMTFNETSLLWESNRSFDSSGTYGWNVTCNGSSQGYEILNVSDDVDVQDNPAWLDVNLLLPPSIPGKGDAENGGGYKVGQNNTFILKANVTCRGGDCGEVNGAVRYNLSSSEWKTLNTTSDIPFYVINSSNGSARNPVSCGTLNENDSCVLNWTINSTGDLSSIWELDVMFNTSTTGNITNSTKIEITKIIIMSISFNELNFGVVNPSTSGDQNPALNNSNYSILAHSNSNSIDNLWIKGTDLEPQENTGYGNITYEIGIGNVTWYNESNFSLSNTITPDYTLITSDLGGGENESLYFWINIPGGLEAQEYRGTLYFLGNSTI